MKQRLIFILFTFYCMNLFAFPWVPSEFLVEAENGQQLKITCNQEANPVANLGHIEKLENFLDCNNQPIEGYCGCLAKKFDGDDPLSPEQVRTLETEMGFFGRSESQHLSQKVKDIALNQQVLRIYGDDKNEACLDINEGGSHSTAYKRVMDSTKKSFASVKETDSEIPAYVNSKYIDEALASQGQILAGKDENFENEINQDYNFLKDIARSIAKEDPQILLAGKTHRDKIMNYEKDGITLIDPNLRAQYASNKALVSWQKGIKNLVEVDYLSNQSSYSTSPLYNSMKRTFKTFGIHEKGSFTGNKQVFFEKMIQAIKKIGFDKDDLKELANGGVVDDSKFKEKLKTKKFKKSMKPLAKELCSNTGKILLQDVRTNILGGAKMNSFNERNYRLQGRALMDDLLNINPNKVDGVKRLRSFSSIQNRLFGQMAKQFDHMEVKTAKNKEDITKYILNRKDQMGRLWCGANYVSSQIEERKAHIENDEEASKIFALAKFNLRELEAQNLKVLKDIRSLGMEYTQIELIVDDLDTRINMADKEMDRIDHEIKGLARDQFNSGKKYKLEDEYSNQEALKNSLARTRIEELKKITDLGDVIDSKEDLSQKIIRTSDEVKRGAVSNVTPRPRVKGVGISAVPTSGDQSAVHEGYLSDQLTSQYKISESLEEKSKGETAVKLIDKDFEDQNAYVFGDAGEIIASTGKDESIKVATTTEELLGIIEESGGLGVRDSISPKMIEEAGSVIVRMTNTATDNLELSNAPEEVKAEHKRKVSNFDKKMTNIMGEMNFTAKGEYGKPKRIRDIIEKSIGTNKKIRQLASMGQKPKKLDRTIPRETASPLVEGSVQKTLAKTQLPRMTIPTNIDTPRKIAKRKEFVTSSISKPKAKSLIDSKLDSLNSAEIKAILSKKMTKKAKVKKPLAAKNKASKILVDPRIQNLRDEIELNKKLSKALNSEIEENSGLSGVLQKRAEKAVTSRKKEMAVTTTPAFTVPKKIVLAPKKKTGRASSGRSLSNVRSFGGGSISASGGGGNSALASRAIEGRVAGGVVVNGEFIPSSLLARTIDLDGIRPVSSGSIVLSSKSSYEAKPSTGKVASKGKQRVKSASFSSLTEDEKEQFIQRELIRLKVDTLVIENSDGSEVVVKSKVELRTRMKVANLNALFEKVDE